MKVTALKTSIGFSDYKKKIILQVYQSLAILPLLVENYQI